MKKYEAMLKENGSIDSDFRLVPHICSDPAYVGFKALKNGNFYLAVGKKDSLSIQFWDTMTEKTAVAASNAF